jgi:ssDNA-binding Zn-finger/Zn-ribbon topoisomerase 1
MKLKDGTATERTCPRCGSRLVVRTQKATGHQFLGCPKWPECSHAEPIPEAVIMKAAGAQTLPGME